MVLLIGGLVFLLLEGILLAVALYYRGRAARVTEAPVGTANGLIPGACKVSGHVVALGETLEAPLSERSCVYYRFVVEEKRTTAGPHGARSYWHTVLDDKESVPFGIDDGTGVVGVTLDGAEHVLRHHRRVETGVFNAPPPELGQLLRERYNVSTKGWLLNKTLRCTETLIGLGDPLFVVGHVELTSAGHGHFARTNGWLIVSDRTEEELTRHYRGYAVVCWITMGLIAAAGAVFLAACLS